MDIVPPLLEGDACLYLLHELGFGVLYFFVALGSYGPPLL